MNVCFREDPPSSEKLKDVEISGEAAGVPVPVRFVESAVCPPGIKRERADPLYHLPSKKSKTEGDEKTSIVLEKRMKMEVWRQEVCLGVLKIGPMRRHQRVVFGRAPNADIRLEHASISRQHAKFEINETGHVLLTDLESGTKFVICLFL